MSRFSFGDYEEEFNNQGELWWSNVRRALRGKKGKAALRELEEALLVLPKPRLAEGYLADGEQVCAVGALIVHHETRMGRPREEVLRELEGFMPPKCACGHRRNEHDNDGCHHFYKATKHPTRPELSRPDRICTCVTFDLSSYDDDDGSYVTATAGQNYLGLTYALAWRLAYANDEEGPARETPEGRYERVLRWVREELAA